MSNLTNELMEKLYNCINPDDLLIADNWPSVSKSQMKSFKKALKLKESAPAYMLKFCKEYQPLTGGNMESLKPIKYHSERFVLTSAQNNTEVNKPFFDSLLKYCDANDAELLIGKFIYNKNGFQNGVKSDDDIYFDECLDPYLVDDLSELFTNLMFCANVNILPTTKFPLSGFENYQGTSSIILPTSKIAMESVATSKHEEVKFIYGTGTVTLKNYIQKKAGQLAEASHTYSALVAEIDEQGNWFVRQLTADSSGGFYDFDSYYNNDILKSVFDPIVGITLGDIHSEKLDNDEFDLACDIIEHFQIDHVFLHDLHDFSSRNHHNRKSGHFLHAMGDRTVRSDLYDAINVLRDLPDHAKIHIVRSNHDDALEAWLDDPCYDYRKDTKNAEIFLQLQLAKYQSISSNEHFILLKYALNLLDDKLDSKFEDNFHFLDIDESFVLQGIECAVHGHLGTNGSRGSPKQFQKLNKPMNTGHTHTASIFGNVYTSGVTGSLDMGYNKGASSWSHSHTIIYANGTRAIITTKNNCYRA